MINSSHVTRIWGMEMTSKEIAQFSASDIRALVLAEYSYRGQDVTSLGTSVLDKMLDHVTDERVLGCFREQVEIVNDLNADPEWAKFHRDTVEQFFDLVIGNVAVDLRFDTHCRDADHYLSDEEQDAIAEMYMQMEAEAEVESQARMDTASEQYALDCEQYVKEDGSIPYFVTAHFMAACEDPNDPSGVDWDDWKDQMKEQNL